MFIHLKFFKRSLRFISYVLFLFSIFYYVNDGHVYFVSSNPQINDVVELKQHIQKEMDVPIEERPATIEIDYNESMLDFESDTMKELFSSGNYNVLAVGGFQARTHNILFDRDYLFSSIKLYYRDTLEDEEYIEHEVNRILYQIISEDMTDYEKVEALNHYLAHNVEYYADIAKDGQSVRVLLEDGTGVCTAYALTMGRMLSKLDIPNLLVAGDGYGSNEWVPHAWNKVQIDGEWYNLDPTWNHPRATSGRHNEYRYFLVSDEYIKDTHRPIDTDLPEAVDTQYENQYDMDFSKE